MRRVVAYMLMSLDGVAQDPETFVLEWDEALDANLADVISTQTAVLLGRGMYDEWARFWPASDMQPFAAFINEVPKHVVTSSPLAEPWTNASRVDGAPREALEAMRSDGEGDIGVHGSLTLTRSLLAADLVDDLRLVVAPRVAGAGRRLFPEAMDARRFGLVSSAATPTGALLLHYRRG